MLILHLPMKTTSGLVWYIKVNRSYEVITCKLCINHNFYYIPFSILRVGVKLTPFFEISVNLEGKGGHFSTRENCHFTTRYLGHFSMCQGSFLNAPGLLLRV